MAKSNTRKPSADREHLVSVIVTTRNEGDVIERLLKSVKDQTHKKLEIIVVDNQSSDATKAISRKYTTSVFDFGPERSAQRNYGARKAGGEYLLFLDADMELTPQVIEECLNIVQRRERVGAASILEDSVAGTFWEKVKAYERSFYNLEGDETTDAARFFKKELFWDLKGYDETITGPEDWDLTERLRKAGYTVEVVRSKILHYERVKSIYSLLRKKYYYGLKSHRYLFKQRVSPASPKTLLFLRPVFCKNWKVLLAHPVLAILMYFMLFGEVLAGGLGFLVGKIRNL